MTVDSARRDLWVFAYGSLMWNPGFAFDEARMAMLRGYHRRLCIWSTAYRGTPEQPGLVLGLDRGGETTGVAYRAAGHRRRQMLAYLFERELDDGVYEPRLLPVHTETGDLKALAFIADPDQPLYAGELTFHETVAAVARGRGRRGTARDSLAGVIDHLASFGIEEPHLRGILKAAESLHE